MEWLVSGQFDGASTDLYTKHTEMRRNDNEILHSVAYVYKMRAARSQDAGKGLIHHSFARSCCFKIDCKASVPPFFFCSHSSHSHAPHAFVDSLESSSHSSKNVIAH
jgi:hypothetical protein